MGESSVTKSLEPSETTQVEERAFLQWTPRGMKRGTADEINQDAELRPGHGDPMRLGPRSPQEAVELLRQGLPVSVFDELRDALDVSARTLAETTNIAMRTLARRKGEGRLHKDESERVLRICALLDRATEVLNGLAAARHWLKSPKRALGGHIPLEYADTEPGAREVEALLTRLEYGVFS